MSEVGSTQVPTGLPFFLDGHIDRLQQATRAITAFLQGYFANRPSGYFRWAPEEDNTEILITGQDPEAIKNPRRPSISVVRGQAGWLGTSRDGISQQSMGSQDWVFTDIASSGCTVNCFAKLSTEAQMLAWITFLGIRIFTSLIQRHGRIHGLGKQMTMSPVANGGLIATVFKDWSLVQVSVPFYVQEAVQISVSNPQFQVLYRDLDLRLQTILGS